MYCDGGCIGCSEVRACCGHIRQADQDGIGGRCRDDSGLGTLDDGDDGADGGESGNGCGSDRTRVACPTPLLLRVAAARATYAAKSSRDIAFVLSYIASRTLRTQVTASNSGDTLPAVLLVFGSIRGHLARRVNRKGLVTRLQIHGVKLTNLVEPNDVAEVPTDDEVGVSDGRRGNVQQVVLKSSMSANNHTANSRSKQPPRTDVSRYTRGTGIP